MEKRFVLVDAGDCAGGRVVGVGRAVLSGVWPVIVRVLPHCHQQRGSQERVVRDLALSWFSEVILSSGCHACQGCC